MGLDDAYNFFYFIKVGYFDWVQGRTHTHHPWDLHIHTRVHVDQET